MRVRTIAGGRIAGAWAAAWLAMSGGAWAQGPAGLRPDQQAFRGLYKELVETNTTLSVGDCTLAAQRMAARLKAGGFPNGDVQVLVAEGHPKEGGLYAVLPGADPSAKALLLLGHLDVVEARREDWQGDPFVLVEENGYFYGRGSSDDKAEDAIWLDSLIRYKQEGYKPRRAIKLALTCGEETAGAFNGAEWLARTHRPLIDAAFALNEGAGGRLDASGKPLVFNIQAGQKFPQNYRLEVTNPGGHSSRPTRDNAIYHLAGGLLAVSRYDFPIVFNDVTRDYYTQMSKIVGGELGGAMAALVANPLDEKAKAIVEADPGYNSMLHTTCVATMLDAGHATNALPQRARANVNCRIFPGESVEAVRAKLEQLVADPEVKVTTLEDRGVASPPPPLTPEIRRPAEALAAEMWPGVPFVPIVSAGATDGVFLNPVGIPTYGISGIFGDPDGGGVHGLNERIRTASLYKGRDYLYRLVKAYAGR